MFDDTIVWVWSGGMPREIDGKKIPLPSLPRRGDGQRRVYVREHRVTVGRGKRARSRTNYKLYDAREKEAGYPDVLDEAEFAMIFMGFDHGA